MGAYRGEKYSTFTALRIFICAAILFEPRSGDESASHWREPVVPKPPEYQRRRRDRAFKLMASPHSRLPFLF